MELGPVIYKGTGDITLHSVPNNNNLIAKKFPSMPDDIEIDAQLIAANIGVSPNIYQSENENIILMDYIRGETLNDFLLENNYNTYIKVPKWLIDKLYKTFEKLYNAGVDHLDKNGNNIIIQNDGQIKIIDFGEVEIYDKINYPKGVPEKRRKYIFDVCPGDIYSDCYDIDVFYNEEEELRKKEKLRLAKLKARLDLQERTLQRIERLKNRKNRKK